MMIIIIIYSLKIGARQQGGITGTYNQWCIGGYMRVYGVYQPPGFF